MSYHELNHATKLEISIVERKLNDINFQWLIPDVEVPDYSVKPEKKNCLSSCNAFTMSGGFKNNKGSKKIDKRKMYKKKC